MTETRKAFHEELAELEADVVALGGMAVEAVQQGTDAFLDADLAAVERVVVSDGLLDELTHSIESRAYVLIARQQPMAIDLRTLVTILRVIHELERIGDLMVNVAKAARRLYPHELEPEFRNVISRMRKQAEAQIRLAVSAFEDHDPVRAGALADMDDVMDDLQRELFRVIFGREADEESSVQRAVQIALVGRYYERIADHAVNTGERVAFMMTGEFLHD